MAFLRPCNLIYNLNLHSILLSEVESQAFILDYFEEKLVIPCQKDKLVLTSWNGIYDPICRFSVHLKVQIYSVYESIESEVKHIKLLDSALTECLVSAACLEIRHAIQLHYQPKFPVTCLRRQTSHRNQPYQMQETSSCINFCPRTVHTSYFASMLCISENQYLQETALVDCHKLITDIEKGT